MCVCAECLAPVQNSSAALVEQLDLLEFHRSIANTYFMKYARAKNAGSTGRPAVLIVRVPADARYDRTDHFVTNVPKQLRCAACPGKAKTKCIKCNVYMQVACFIRFHKRRYNSYCGADFADKMSDNVRHFQSIVIHPVV